MPRLCFAAFFAAVLLSAKQPLLVVSVDGLDHRYLANCDRLGLKIPHIRKMIAKGVWADKGVLGVVPTITWPSHTTLITGVEPRVHGITSNRMPSGDYPWSAKLLHAKTLIDSAHEAGLKTGAITWPVTVDAPLDYNLPEYFKRRRGGGMDLRSIESKATPPNLVKEILRASPSFAQEWMDDRTRTQAVVFLLRQRKLDLLLVHLVDLDSEQHDNAPFSREALSQLEYTDELLGEMLAAKPVDMAAALVSDHGFEQVNSAVNLAKLAAEQNITGITPKGFIVTAHDENGVTFLNKLAGETRYGVGRRIPKEEVARFSPDLLKEAAVFECADGFEFAGKATDPEIFSKPREIGNHGHWPTRYHPVFVITGTAGAPERLGELPMTQVVLRFAQTIGVPFTPGQR